MPRYLMLTLHGPLVAWGEIAVGERRGSEVTPSRTAVLGLVAAALGVQRADEAAHRALDDGYAMAARIDASGAPLRDFHTAQVPSSRKGVRWRTRGDELAADDLNTIISTRDYHVDALATVVLAERGSAPYPLERIKVAVERPHFVLYLGRRSCPPSLPLAPEIVEAADLVEALRARRPFLVPGRTRPARVPLRFDGDMPGAPPAAQVVSRRDALESRGRRQFGERWEHVASVDAA